MSGRKYSNVFEAFNSWVNSVEVSVVNLISTLAPWGAPIVPAMATYWHVTGTLGFPTIAGVVIAFVVEALGLSTVRTAMQFWAHNRRYKNEKNQAPIVVPIFAFFFYLLLIITVNILLEITQDLWVRVMSIALLSLLEIPAALILAVRTLYSDLLEEIANRYKPQAQKEPTRIVEVQQPARIMVDKQVTRMVWEYLKENNINPLDVGRNKQYSPADLARTLDVNPESLRTALFRIRKYLEENENNGTMFDMR